MFFSYLYLLPEESEKVADSYIDIENALGKRKSLPATLYTANVAGDRVILGIRISSAKVFENRILRRIFGP